MPRFKITLVIILSFLLSASQAGVNQDHPMDVVFCVDLSGSTNGIVDEFRENYSHIVNQLASLKPKPNIRVGLVAFSRKSYGKKNAYVKLLSPLSSDLDQVGREFWKLKKYIEKGDQYVAAALTTAIDDINWTKDPNGIKLMYLVGNGIVSLGTTSYTEVCERAVQENIIINTVYCKPSNLLRELTGWRRIASITSGKQYEIELGKENKVFETDADIVKIMALNKKLNSSYIGFGEHGTDNVEVMTNSDRILEKGHVSAFLARMFFKISDDFYGAQSDWDLVDWQMAGNKNFRSIDRKNLLKEYRQFTNAELEYLIYKNKVKRQEAIAELKVLLTPELLAAVNNFILNDLADNEKFEKVIVNSLIEFSMNRGFTASVSSPKTK